MRIAVGQLWQETNTFNRNATTFADFENWGVALGDQVIEEFGRTGELGGFLEEFGRREPDVSYHGLARFACWPWGSVDRETWERIQAAFRDGLNAADSIDAVFIALHGAMAADGEEDLTGALLQTIRSQVGAEVPIVGTLDLHANVTRRMIESADLLVGYHACPHLDSAQTGARAAAGLADILKSCITPTTLWRKLPMITAAENHNTFTGIPAPWYRRLEEWERDEDVLSAGLYMAMPWFDAGDLGWTITLTTRSRKSRYKKMIEELAADCWQRRGAMEDVERFPPSEVVDRALQHDGHPIVVGDGADATNSGAPGDQTHLLREFLKRDRIPHGALTFLVDPDAVSLAFKLGTGNPFLAMVGAAFAPEYAEPVELRGTVERLLDVQFTLDGHIGNNLPIRMGRGAVIRAGNVCVLLTERTGPGSTPKLYETAGLDPKTFGIVVAKSPAGFRAEYEPFAAGMELADCPGAASPHWKRLNFFRVNRPLWPLDEIHETGEARWCAPLRGR